MIVCVGAQKWFNLLKENHIFTDISQKYHTETDLCKRNSQQTISRPFIPNQSAYSFKTQVCNHAKRHNWVILYVPAEEERISKLTSKSRFSLSCRSSGDDDPMVRKSLGMCWWTACCKIVLHISAQKVEVEITKKKLSVKSPTDAWSRKEDWKGYDRVM
jgi:hypothetical protein